MNEHEFCGHCGEPVAEPHPTCQTRLSMEPPRFCRYCRRRMKVQVSPTGWHATCVEHGRTASTP